MEASGPWRPALFGRRRCADRLRVEPLEDRTCPSTLLLTTAGDVSGAGTPGITAWTGGTALEFGGPNFALDPAKTTGTFSALFDLNQFADSDVHLDGLHEVRATLTLGTGANTFTVQPGDLILSIDKDGKTLTSLNQLTVGKDDVFVFRPQAPGDYSAGTFFPLLDNFKAVTGIGDTWAVALVEADTAVGDVTLPAGSVLFSGSGGAAEHDVRLFVPTGVGTGATAGTASVLIAGSDLGIEPKLVGIDLVESPTTVGGRVLQAGTLLLAVDGDAAVGSTATAVTRFDVFAVTVTQTTLESGTAVGKATLLFRGSDVGLTGGSEALREVSLANGDTGPAAAADAYTTPENTRLVVPGPGVLANDTDPNGNPLTAVLVSGPAHGTLTLNPDGGFAYTPDAGFHGPDSFTYRATNGAADSNAVRVTILVRRPTPTPHESPPPPAKPPAAPPPALDPGPAPGPNAPPPVRPPAPAASAPGPFTTPVFGVPVGAVSLGPTVFVSAPGAPAFVPVNPPVAATIPAPPALPPLPTIPVPPTPGPDRVPVGPILVPPPEVTAVGPAPRALPPAAEEALDAELAELGAQVQAGKAGRVVTDVTIATGVLATAGYVFLTPKLAYWLLGALLARRTVWKPFDPLEVVYAWEEEQARANRPAETDDESLESMVRGKEAPAP